MTAPTLTWEQILALKDYNPPPDDTFLEVIAVDYPDHETRAFTVAEVTRYVNLYDLFLILNSAAESDPDISRRFWLFAADCAAHVSHVSSIPRSRFSAIVAGRQFARGEISYDVLAAAWGAPKAHVWAAALTAFSLAPLDAGWAAAKAVKDDGIEARDAWEAACSAAKAAELQWQFDRLIAWFSDNEPEDWPIAEVTTQEDAQ